jgi:hypothetical protein
LFINQNYFKKVIIIVISLQRTFLCKLNFIDENNIKRIQFSSCLFLVFILVSNLYLLMDFTYLFFF